MSLRRVDSKGNVFIPYIEVGSGIALSDRSNLKDSEKWRRRVHVDSEAEAIEKIRKDYHLWMEKADGSSSRPNLITPNSIEGWR